MIRNKERNGKKQKVIKYSFYNSIIQLKQSAALKPNQNSIELVL